MNTAQDNMVCHHFDLNNMPPLTDKQRAELQALADAPDDDIDYSDIPPMDSAAFVRAVPNPLFKALKQSTTVRYDSDTLSWVRSHGHGYQSRLNSMLRGSTGYPPALHLRRIDTPPLSAASELHDSVVQAKFKS